MKQGFSIGLRACGADSCWPDPPDQLVSSGMEGPDTEDQTPIRSVTGGTGKYLGAEGAVLQHGRSMNTTTLATLELPTPKLPVRVRARLAVPDGQRTRTKEVTVGSRHDPKGG